MRRLIILLIAFSFMAMLVSCGPVKSTMVINDTERLLDRAQTIQADKKLSSKYYYYAAEEYLKKAKDEEGHSDFESAEHFGKKALNLARKAVKKAKIESSNPAAAPSDFAEGGK